MSYHSRPLIDAPTFYNCPSAHYVGGLITGWSSPRLSTDSTEELTLVVKFIGPDISERTDRSSWLIHRGQRCTVFLENREKKLCVSGLNTSSLPVVILILSRCRGRIRMRCLSSSFFKARSPIS